MSSSDPSSNPQDFFSLEAVYLAWLLRDASGAEYMKQARENGLAVGFVSVTERKSVVDWLEGRIADLERITPLTCTYLVLISPVQRVDEVWIHCLAEAGSTTPPGSPPRSFLASASGSFPAPSASLSASRSLDSLASPPKRRYVPDHADMEVVKKIKANEIELRDRNTVLRGVKQNVSS